MSYKMTYDMDMMRDKEWINHGSAAVSLFGLGARLWDMGAMGMLFLVKGPMNR